MRNRDKVNDATKKCIDCKNEYENTTNWFNKRSGLNCLNSRCKTCEAKDYENRRADIKKQAFELIGYDNCKLCGYNKFDFNLAFHHLDPNTKDISISSISSKSIADFKLSGELKKCILICENHHSEIHAGLHQDILIPQLVDSKRQNYRRVMMAKIKQQCVDYLGGRCMKCNYNNCNRALEFHHSNSSEKEFSMAERREASFEKLKSELNKCSLLCRNCHREEHYKNKTGTHGA
jgi:hypothetical protein